MAAILPAVCSVIPVSAEVDFGFLSTNLLLGFLCICLYMLCLSLQVNKIIIKVCLFKKIHIILF